MLPREVGMDWFPITVIVAFAAFALSAIWKSGQRKPSSLPPRRDDPPVRYKLERDGIRVFPRRHDVGKKLRYQVRSKGRDKSGSITIESGDAGQFIYTGEAIEAVVALTVMDSGEHSHHEAARDRDDRPTFSAHDHPGTTTSSPEPVHSHAPHTTAEHVSHSASVAAAHAVHHAVHHAETSSPPPSEPPAY